MTTYGAVNHLLAGNIIAYPTEFCFGIGCLANNSTGMRRIRAIKTRPVESAFIIIGHSLEQFYPYMADLSQEEMRVLNETWPAPITFLVRASDDVSPLLTGKTGEVAIRIPAHALARELCKAAGSAIVSTSANRRGTPPLLSAKAVREEFGQEIDWVVDASCGGYNKPSTIIRLADNSIVRE